MQSIELIAWLATLFCVLCSVRHAVAFLSHNPRYFTIMALFSLVWALLLPYYGGKVPPSELFAAFGGFVLVYIGGIMRREAKNREVKENPPRVDDIDRLALWILPLLAAPFILEHGKIRVELSQEQTELILATVLDILGYIAIIVGSFALLPRSDAFVITFILIVYSSVEIFYTISAFGSAKEMLTDLMKPELEIAFSALKIVFVVTFCWFVTRTGMNQEDRALPFMSKLVKLLTRG